MFELFENISDGPIGYISTYYPPIYSSLCWILVLLVVVPLVFLFLVPSFETLLFLNSSASWRINDDCLGRFDSLQLLFVKCITGLSLLSVELHWLLSKLSTPPLWTFRLIMTSIELIIYSKKSELSRREDNRIIFSSSCLRGLFVSCAIFKGI